PGEPRVGRSRRACPRVAGPSRLCAVHVAAGQLDPVQHLVQRQAAAGCRFPLGGGLPAVHRKSRSMTAWASCASVTNLVVEPRMTLYLKPPIDECRIVRPLPWLRSRSAAN